MRYNIRVGALPDDVDTTPKFLDYLIFEKQEGYCVYYASAFVLISRYIGIPSRFVQGYRIELHNRGSEVITENSAHAWPECYIEGIGCRLRASECRTDGKPPQSLPKKRNTHP